MVVVGGLDNVVGVASGIEGGWSGNDDRVSGRGCASESCRCRNWGSIISNPLLSFLSLCSDSPVVVAV